MPLGLLSDEEFERELSQGKKESHTKESHPGRDKGDYNVPDSLRQIIGEESVINGRQSALSLAKDFGISPSSVSAYAVGATSTTTYHNPSQSIISHINKSRARASKRASKVLNSALIAISQEKLDYADPKDLAGIAKDMACIIKQLEPPQQQVAAETRAPQFVIFAPSFRREDSFDIIDVKE